jgi:alanine racemase
LDRLRELAAGAEVMPILKGNAYGLGAVDIALYLERRGVACFGVDSVAEAVPLREAGLTARIVVLDGDVADAAPEAVGAGVTPAIGNQRLLAQYECLGRELDKALPVWLVANVGFNRSGPRPGRELDELLRAVCACPHIRIEAVIAHMSDAHDDEATSLLQIARYREVADATRRALGSHVQTSILASHGVVRWGDVHRHDLVRPGILLYGEHILTPAVTSEPRIRRRLQGFEPVLRLRACITQIVHFPREECVGYGRTHVVPAGTRLATVALGYGYGYPVSGNGLSVLVHGIRAPIVGAVVMDALQVDVTHVPSVAPYDWATLLGEDGEDRIGLAELAQKAGLSPYVVMRQLRCHRLFAQS